MSNPYLNAKKRKVAETHGQPLTNGSSHLSQDNEDKSLPTSSSWSTPPGAITHDFHSDTITTPTLSMLRAISSCSLVDDVYHGDPTTIHLESKVASMTGQEAGLLVMSGTMGNQIALRTHLGHPPHSVLCDIRAHVNKYEAGGIATLCGAQLLCVMPRNGKYLTLEDVKDHVVISDDVHDMPTRVISLENTLNGMIMPLDETKRIVDFARSNDILCHLDGARIWEAAAATTTTTTTTTTDRQLKKTLQNYCELFDSVSVCLSKGLGAPIGSVLVGSTKFIARAKRIRKMYGGGTRQSGIIAAAGLTAITDTFEGGLLTKCHENARRIAAVWERGGGKLAFPTQTNMVWLDVEGSGVDLELLGRVCAEEGVVVSAGKSARIVVHYQIAGDAIDGVCRAFGRVMEGKGRDGEMRDL